MALIFADRIQETTATTGTGSLALGGALTGFRTFNAMMANNDTCYYLIDGGTTGAWELGLGTYTDTDTLARTTVLKSSNSDSLVSFAAGTKNVFLTFPAFRAQYHPVVIVSATIATTGNTDNYIIAPETGKLESVVMSPLVALATSDTNYITWSITNLGQAGAGSTVMLAASDANTTKATGGTALAANTKRTLTVHGTPANLDVVAGDRLLIRAAATGTLANTVTVPVYLLTFTGA